MLLIRLKSVIAFFFQILSGVFPLLLTGLYFRIYSFSRLLKITLLIALFIVIPFSLFVLSIPIHLLLGLLAGLFIIFLIAWRLHPYYLMVKSERLTKRKPVKPSQFLSWEDFTLKGSFGKSIEGLFGDDETMLGIFDQEGRILTEFKDLPISPMIDTAQFIPRVGFQLSIVVKDDLVLVKKQYNRDRRAFAREWYNLLVLDGLANVPKVWAADRRNLTLYISYFQGKTFREILQEKGVQFNTEKNYAGDRHVVVAHAVQKWISRDILDKLRDQIDRIHQLRIVRLDLKAGNFILGEDSSISLIDFEYPFYLPRWMPFLAILRDRDRVIFNRRFNTNWITEKTMQDGIREIRSRNRHLFPPLLLGRGLILGNPFNFSKSYIEVYQILKHKIESFRNGRLLCIGLGSDFFPLNLFQNGDSEIVVIESDNEKIAKIQWLHDVLLWRKGIHQRVKIYQDDADHVLNSDIGHFDVAFVQDVKILPWPKLLPRIAALSHTLVIHLHDDGTTGYELKGKNEIGLVENLKQDYHDVQNFNDHFHESNSLVTIASNPKDNRIETKKDYL